MKPSDCVCGHEKRDHRAALSGMRYGACKVCLCDAYTKPAVLAPPPPQPASAGSHVTPAIGSASPSSVLPVSKFLQ